SHEDIDIHPDVIAGLNCIAAGMAGEDFFGQGHRRHERLTPVSVNSAENDIIAARQAGDTRTPRRIRVGPLGAAPRCLKIAPMPHLPTGQPTRGFSWRSPIVLAACLAAVLIGGWPSPEREGVSPPAGMWKLRSGGRCFEGIDRRRFPRADLLEW